jgi:ankyrin repeat protein
VGDEGSPRYPRLVGKQGGLTAMLFAARQGYTDAVDVLLSAGASVNQVDPGDKTSPLMIAIINGHFDLAEKLLAAGADPNAAQINGATPLYAVLNCQWAPKADYPQPTAYKQQHTTYLTLLSDLLAHGANPNARLKEKVWYTSYNRDYSGLDESGATPFWRAAWADDVDAMKLLMAHGADPNLATINPGSPVSIYQRPGYGLKAVARDYSGLPVVPKGGPDIPPLLAASGEEFGSSLTAGKLRWSPAGMLPAVQYLVEDLHANVNARDAKGNTALHNAAARGDNAMILYLVSKGADITAVNRRGQTVADMANGPFQRIDPFPETIALAEKLGARLMHKCVSCGG